MLFFNRNEQDLQHFERDYTLDNIFVEYLAFSVFWQDAFVKINNSDILTKSFRTNNLYLLRKFNENIKKHPILWKFFRFIFGV